MKQADTAYDVETPEGVVLKLSSAGLPVRFYAYFIDFLIRWTINMLVAIAINLVFGEAAMGILLIYYFLMEWFYPVYFEVYRRGQTPGKKRMKIKVLNGDGTPIGWQSSLIRNFLIVVDIWFFGFLSCLIDPRSRRLGDLAGDTAVVYEKNILPGRLPEAKPSHPPVNLTIDEQKAVISFAERYKMLSGPRKEELAEILAGVHKKKTTGAVESILQYAAAISGQAGKSQ